MTDKETILVIGQNLFFLPRIQNVADPYGYEVRLTTSKAMFRDQYQQGKTALILTDLEGDRDVWTSVITELREQAGPTAKIVAFGPHADVETLKLARDLGCDAVLTKGEFSKTLHKIIETRGKGVSD